MGVDINEIILVETNTVGSPVLLSEKYGNKHFCEFPTITEWFAVYDFEISKWSLDYNKLNTIK